MRVLAFLEEEAGAASQTPYFPISMSRELAVAHRSIKTAETMARIPDRVS